MLTKQDLNKIESLLLPLATRSELQSFKKDISEDILSLKESVNSLATAIDGLIGAIDNLRIEYSAITSQLNRHDRWIQQIARKSGVKLEVSF